MEDSQLTYYSGEEPEPYKLQLFIQDFAHIYGIKQSKPQEFPESVPIDFCVLHEVETPEKSRKRGRRKMLQIIPYLPVQQQHPSLCDDPTNPYFYSNDPRPYYPDKLVELPHPGLIIRPVAPELVQGLTPSGAFVVQRATEQAQYYQRYEHKLSVIVYLYAQMLHNAILRAEATLRQIMAAIKLLQAQDVGYFTVLMGNVNMLEPEMLDLDLTKFNGHDKTQFLLEQVDRIEELETKIQPCMLPLLNNYGPALLDFDELDLIDQLEPERFHGQFDSYRGAVAKGSIAVIAPSGVVLSVRRPGRRFTCYETVLLLQKLCDGGTARSIAHPQSNRQKYNGGGFEDESGECRVCGDRYSSIFTHCATESHRRLYAAALDQPINSKYKAAGRVSETCRQFIDRHGAHLVRRSALMAQLQALGNELAVNQSLQYHTAVRALTDTLYHHGLNIRVDSVDRPARASSPTLQKSSVSDFFTKNLLDRAASIERYCLDANEDQGGVNYYSELYAKTLVQHGSQNLKFKVYSDIIRERVSIRPGDCFYSAEQFAALGYTRNSLAAFAAFAQRVAQAVPVDPAVRPRYVVFTQAQLDRTLKNFEVDIMDDLAVRIAGFIGGVVGDVSAATVPRIPRFEKLDCSYYQFVDHVLEDPETRAVLARLYCLNEEVSLCPAPRAGSARKPAARPLPRSNSVVWGTDPGLRPDQITPALLGRQLSPGGAPSGDAGLGVPLFRRRGAVLQHLCDALDTGLLIQNNQCGVDFRDAALLYLEAANVAHAGHSQIEYRTILHYSE